MTFKPANQSITVTLPYHCAFIVITEIENDRYAVYYMYNNSGGSLNRTLSANYNARYYVTTNSISGQANPTCRFFDSNGHAYFSLFDSSSTDTAYSVLYLKNTFVDFLWIHN